MTGKRTWGAGVMLALAIGLAIVAGCANDETTGPSATVPSSENLTTLNGGLTSADEAPGFGDVMLVNSVSAQSPQTDVMAQDLVVVDIEAGRTIGAQLYAVTIMWGMLQSSDSGDTEGGTGNGVPYDWSGSVAVSHGILVLKSVISFEAGDHMGVRSSLLPKELNWVSHTSTGFDGVRFLVYEQPQQGGQAAPSMTVNTPMYQGTISLSEVARADTLITVDGYGNKIYITSFPALPGESVRGYLQGHWTAMTTGDSLSHFTGIWVNPRADVKGFVRGHYGVNLLGQRLFFGKYVDVSGKFQGILRGTWGVTGPDPSAADGQIGWFLGRWIDATGAERGQIRGAWGTAGPQRSLVLGEWCSDCSFGATGR